MEISELLRRYIVEREAHGRSPNTIRWQTIAIELFCREAGVGTLEELSPERLLGWLAEKRRQPGRSGRSGVTLATLSQYERAIRPFLRWLYRRGYAERDLSGELPRYKPPKQVVKPFSPEELRAFFEALREPPNVRRKLALYRLLLDTGVRRGEAAGLTLGDVNWRERLLRVSGKTGERIVYFSERSLRALHDYIEHERRPRRPGEERLFLNRHGDPLRPEEITQEAIRIARRAGINGAHVGPHTFRHTFAVEFLRGGGDLRSLQLLLGHSKLETSSIYLGFSSDMLRDAHRRFSPLERMKL
jgi:site-specific recombinase XerD